MDVRKIIGATLIVAGLVAYCDCVGGNVVGFQSQVIRKGAQELTIPFFDLSTGSKFTVAAILGSAIEGDSIAFGDFCADAVFKDGALHWVRFGEIRDDEPLPPTGSKVSYYRQVDRTTDLTLAGQVDEPTVFDASEAPVPSKPPQVSVPTPKPPEQYLADVLSYSTVQIVNMTGPQEADVGTGFFFYFRMKDGKHVVPAIVTNRHVADNATNTYFTFTIAQDGRPSDKQIRYVTNYSTGDKWIFHADPQVDLAVLPLRPITELLRKKANVEIYHCPLSVDFIPDEDYFSGITQMDDVYMIGYPQGIADKVNNQPIFRKGAIATRPNKNYEGRREFLVDMAVYGGSSGSPIVLASETSYPDRRAKRMSPTGRLKLIGVLWGGYEPDKDLKFRTVPAAKLGAVKIPCVSMPINLGLVIHASRLREMEEQIQRMFGE